MDCILVLYLCLFYGFLLPCNANTICSTSMEDCYMFTGKKSSTIPQYEKCDTMGGACDNICTCRTAMPVDGTGSVTVCWAFLSGTECSGWQTDCSNISGSSPTTSSPSQTEKPTKTTSKPTQTTPQLVETSALPTSTPSGTRVPAPISSLTPSFPSTAPTVTTSPTLTPTPNLTTPTTITPISTSPTLTDKLPNSNLTDKLPYSNLTPGSNSNGSKSYHPNVSSDDQLLPNWAIALLICGGIVTVLFLGLFSYRRLSSGNIDNEIYHSIHRGVMIQRDNNVSDYTMNQPTNNTTTGAPVRSHLDDEMKSIDL